MTAGTERATEALEAVQRLLGGIGSDGDPWCTKPQLRALIAARTVLEQLADWEV